jgi:hypothetical protein
MDTPQPPDDVQPVLHTVEEELERQLHDVCENQEVSNETTGELLRLEEALLSAARAAKETISLRRERRETMRRRATRAGEVQAPVPTSTEEPTPHDVRSFAAEGKRWRVWAVRPGHARPVKDAERTLLGEYQSGWLVFETEDGARRRLPNYPADWMHSTDDALRELLTRATEAKRRRS